MEQYIIVAIPVAFSVLAAIVTKLINDARVETVVNNLSARSLGVAG